MGASGKRPLKSESLLTQTRKLLRRYNLRVRKGLGQHFLVSEEVLNSIISTAELTPKDIVIEVGPGLGVLTGELARQSGWVLAVELDDQLSAILRRTLAPLSNVTVVNEDVLKVDLAALLDENKVKFPPGVESPFSYNVIANLPYYITSPVLRHFLEASVKPRIMVVMVQKEVAEEIAAKPGRMSLLSVSVQLYGQPQIISYVPPGCFYPAPEVDSAVVKITVYSQPAVDVFDTQGFFKLVRAGFSASRKQIANSLAQGLGVSKDEALSLLATAEIAQQRRAETLTLEEWARLWRVFSRWAEAKC